MSPMPRVPRWAVAVAAAVLVLGACAGSPGRATAPTTGSSVTSTSTPATTEAGAASVPSATGATTTTPAALTPAARYLMIVAPANKVLAAFTAAQDGDARATILQDLSAVLGLIDLELRAVVWPAAAEEAVAQMVSATSAAATSVNLFLSNPSEQALSAFNATVVALSAASSKVRLVLGLPPGSGG